MSAELEWRNDTNRENIASKIEEAIHNANIISLRNGVEMEQHIFEKSTSWEQYYLYIAGVVTKIRECGVQFAFDLAGASYADVEQPIIDPLSDIPGLGVRRPCSVDLRGRRRILEMDYVPNMPMPSVRSGSMLTPSGRSAQSEKYKGDYSWKIPAFRKSIIAKFDAYMQKYGRPTSKNSMEMEQLLFEKAKSRDEYTGFVERVLHHIQEVSHSCTHPSDDDIPLVSDISDLIPDPLSDYLSKSRGRRVHNPSFYYSGQRGTSQKAQGG